MTWPPNTRKLPKHSEISYLDINISSSKSFIYINILLLEQMKKHNASSKQDMAHCPGTPLCHLNWKKLDVH